MAKAKSKRLPEFDSLDDLVAFFDTHDMGDYWEEMKEAAFDIRLKKSDPGGRVGQSWLVLKRNRT